ncbi:hypothetical protein BAE44_0017112 [Dichanthelium oligosanthes]|uniref:Uncharacterized protein n=1 Tax=Dichanthelium oligosanthes TaxID=888268 RepID=A0A1E5V9P7_9POAL|nr:hypothetical protein BAE44_0017112 [Dichanthelium oligosanthes]
MLVPMVLYTFPFIYQVYTGSYDETTKLFGTPAMVAAFVNSILWLMYGTVISKSDTNLSLLLLHAFISMSSFNYLMSVYADRRATRKGYMLGASFIISLSVIFVVMYWDTTPSEIIKKLFGYCGLGSLVYCHWIQINDILYGITERSQQIATAVILLPNCLVNLETLMITAQLHPSHEFILLSSTIGSVGNVLELLLIIIVTLGRFFLSTEKTNVDLEAATQNIHTSNVSGGVTTQNVASEMASTQDVTRVLGRDNSIVGPTLRQRQEAIIIVQGTMRHEVIAVRNMLDTSSYTYTRVILEQSIPRIMLLIERDLYFPMLLHASGMTNTRPHPMMIRHLEIRYWLLNWLPLLEMSRQQRWALAGMFGLKSAIATLFAIVFTIGYFLISTNTGSEIAVSDVLQLAGQDGIEESDVNRMERKQMKRKRLTEEEVVPPPLPSNENKRIKLGKGSWIMHLVMPLALAHELDDRLTYSSKRMPMPC